MTQMASSACLARSILVAGAVLSAAPATAQTTEAAPALSAMPAPSLLARQFSTIAFSAEFGGAHRRGRIVKWVSPIRVRVRGFNSVRYLEEVRQQLQELRTLTGLPIELVNWSNAALPANLDINFVVQQNNRGRFDPTAPCRTLFRDRGFVIRRVEIFIAPDNPAQRRHCIAEELTQAMGLANDSTLIPNSIFSDASRQPILTPWDRLMVRILYDPKIRPGMRQRDAMPIVHRIIAQQLARLSSGTAAQPRR